MVGAEDQELASWRRFKFTVLSSAGEIGKGEANRESGTEHLNRGVLHVNRDGWSMVMSTLPNTRLHMQGLTGGPF